MISLPTEMWYEILKYIDDLFDFCATQATCRMFARFYSPGTLIGQRIKKKYTNHLANLIRLFPDAVWNVNALASNPNMTWDCIQEFIALGFEWDLYSLSMNPNITWEIVQNISSESSGFIGDWYYSTLCQNPGITWEDIVDNWKKLGYHQVAANPNITWDILQNPPPNSEGMDWDYVYASFNPNITWDIFTTAPQFKFNGVSAYNFVFNPHCTPEVVNNNSTKFHNVLRSMWVNDNFNIEDGQADESICCMTFGQNQSITQDLLSGRYPEYLEIIGEYRVRSASMYTTWREVYESSSQNWDFRVLSGNSFNKHRLYSTMNS